MNKRKGHRRRSVKKTPGKLMIIGGKEQVDPNNEILKNFVQLAGGKRARIVIISVVSEPPSKPSDRIEIFKRIGASSVEELVFYTRSDGEDQKMIDKIKDSTAVFINGGNQLLITNVICGTTASDVIKENHRNGKIIGGTSAGASVMSSTMIVEPVNGDDKTAKRNNLSLAPGMGLVERIVIDQHFAERGRINRIITALALNPSVICLGIDENTALVLNPDQTFTVVGDGTVTVLDGRQIQTDTIATSDFQSYALSNVKLHIVPRGCGFDLETRKLTTIQPN
jgi:cyanophycinase